MDVQVVVIGGGPAGSCTAAALAQSGHRVALIESEPFPRFHIGESLLPYTNAVFARLGLMPKMEAAGFVRKFGATFLDADCRRFVYDFGDLSGDPTAVTFQVPRADFDALLFGHAREQGVNMIAARALAVRIANDGVEVDTDQGSTVRAQMLVDASGRAGLLARKFDLRRPDAQLQKVAAYAHYTGVPRDEGRRGGDIRVLSIENMGWLWFIPLPDGVVSIGVVHDLATWQRAGKPQPEAFLATALERSPVARELVRGASRVSQVRFESTFSYGTRAFAGRRWLIVGDAGAFLDPVFSSGVTFAMRGAMHAADTVAAALKTGPDHSDARASVAAYEREQQRLYRFVRRFVLGFYQPGFRDLLFAPTPRFGLVRAVTKVLAGFWAPPLADRLRLALVFGLARVQRRVAIVPRRHLADATSYST